MNSVNEYLDKLDPSWGIEAMRASQNRYANRHLIKAYQSEEAQKKEAEYKAKLIESNIDKVINHDEAILSFNDFTKAYHPHIDFKKFRKGLVRNLLFYFIGLEGDYKTSQGIALIGQTGTFKTSFFKLFNHYALYLQSKKLISYNQYDKIICSIKPTEQICADIKAAEGLEPVYQLIREDKTICLDDLGLNDYCVKTYGQDLFPIQFYINDSYNKERKLHFTSNCSMTADDPNGIYGIFGQRIWSRLHEMCNIVYISGEDFRTKHL